MTAARRFNPVFTATVVPSAIESLDGAKGPYTLMRGAVVLREGREDMVRTVMAFGKPNSQIAHLLEEGRPINLAIRFDRGTVKVVGLPKQAEANPLSNLVAHEPGTPYVETVIKTLYGILAAHGVDRDYAEGIIQEMLTGESDRVSADDEGLPYEPETIETLGHILAPLVDAGIDHAEALAIATSIVALPIAEYLYDVLKLRQQNAARALVLAD